MSAEARCRICGGERFEIRWHTARCAVCGVIMLWPYLPDDDTLAEGEGKPFAAALQSWYDRASFLNHVNFTNMLRFTLDESYKGRTIDILDYGGGAGQFALVCRSHFPAARVFITDIDDNALMDAYRPVNIQLPYRSFAADDQRFDAVFMNDVFEHLSDPVGVLSRLSKKLKPGGRIFIDTPRQFWAYPLMRAIAPPLYGKLLRGTVSIAHLQIWSRRSFALAVKRAGLSVVKYREINEYSMPAEHYLGLMGIRNRALVFAANLFYRPLRHLARNKILCVLIAQAERETV